MKNPIVIVVIVVALFLVIGVGILLAMFVGGFMFYRSGIVPPNAPSEQKALPVIDTTNLKKIDLTGAQKDTQKLFVDIYKKQGLEGVKAYLDNNLSLPANIQVNNLDQKSELTGVTYVVVYQGPKKIGGWGNEGSAHKIHALGIFPNGIGVEAESFAISFYHQDKIDSK